MQYCRLFIKHEEFKNVSVKSQEETIADFTILLLLFKKVFNHIKS